MARRLLGRDEIKPEDAVKDFRRPSRDDDEDDFSNGAKTAAKLLGKAEGDDEKDDEDEDAADKRTVRRLTKDVFRALDAEKPRRKVAPSSTPMRAAPVKKPVRSAAKAKSGERVTVFRGAALGRLLQSVGAPRLRTMTVEPTPRIISG